MSDDSNLINQNIENKTISETDTASFAKDVIEASKEIPIVVDFWADWCAPCKQLGPILESVINSYNGQVRLIKIDADKNQELTQQLRIQSLPTVFAFFNGQPIDGFSGALPENEVRNFIKKVIGASGGDKTEKINSMIEEAESLFENNQFEEALNAFSLLLSEDANNSKVISGYGKCLLKLNKEKELNELIESLEENILSEPPLVSLLAMKELEIKNKNAGKPEDFKEKVISDPGNHSLRFQLAEALLAQEKKEEAIDHLLEIVKKDRKWENDKARKKIIELLNAYGEDDPLTASTRLKLSSILFA
tara:strand:- start:4787 stop:5704 length:918 start_codon:yes stop_codon:yes gene_type:complete